MKNGNTTLRNIPKNVELILPDGQVFPEKKAGDRPRNREFSGAGCQPVHPDRYAGTGRFSKAVVYKIR